MAAERKAPSADDEELIRDLVDVLRSHQAQVDAEFRIPSDPPDAETEVLITRAMARASELAAAPDYRALLVKYIQFVNDAQVRNADPYPTEHQFPPAGFTDAEWAELQRLAEEAGR